MAFNATMGRLFIAAIVKEAQLSKLLRYGQIEHLFTANELPVYEFVYTFAKKHGKLPEAKTVLAHTEEELPNTAEPSSYYNDLMCLRFNETELKKTLQLAAKFLAPGTKDINKAFDTVVDLAYRLKRAAMGSQVMDFRQAQDLIIPDYVSKWTDTGGAGIKLGWPTLDNMTGGLVTGDVLSIVGRPGQGKTWQMLHATHHAWREQEACILFASMEMKQLPIQQRLIAIESKLSTAGVKNATLTTVGLAKLKGSLTQIKTAKSAFWVTDGNLSATVDDIDLLCNILKPDLVAIDGAYLLKHPTERDRFRRAAENVELIKQRLADRCPVIASWQFAKSGSKKNKKKGEKTDLDDIGYTDAIAQISSIVLGLMQIESVETMQTRVVDILKGRNGEIGQFKTKWDFINTDFSEVIEEPVEDLQYV